MRNENHRNAFFFIQTLNRFHNISSADRIKHCRRLIQNNTVRLHRQHACNGNSLFLPTGKLGRRISRKFLHSHCIQCFIHAHPNFLRGYAHIFGAKCNILLNHRCNQLVIGVLEYHPCRLANLPNQAFLLRVHSFYPQCTACGL